MGERWRKEFGQPDKARVIAIGATRAYLRLCGIDPKCTSVKNALKSLDELQRAYPGKICAYFSEYASETQVKLFIRDWKRWLKEAEGEHEKS
jgi:hypothetical protein